MPRTTDRVPAGAVALVAAALLAGSPSGGAAPAGPRVASINACTDQLLLRLADRTQIATVSHYATDPGFSYMAGAASGVPVNHGHAEEVLAHDPDLVLSGPYTKHQTVDRLETLGYPVVTLKGPEDFAGIRANIRRTARLVGHPGRGRRLVQHMDATLAYIRERIPPPGERMSALVLRPNGVTVGKGSLLDSIIRRAGLRNAGRSLGAGVYAEVPLERLVWSAPDVLIMASMSEAPPSRAQGVLHHPVFTALDTSRQPVWLPGRLWSCGGWFTAEAVARLAAHAYGIRVPDNPGRRAHGSG